MCGTCLPNLIRLSGEVARTCGMESLRFPSGKSICDPVLSVAILVQVLPVGGGVGQHDHAALCKNSHGFVTRGSKDAINTMAKQTCNIQLPMKQFNAE